MLQENWVLEGGWVQKKLFDIGWSDESRWQACHKEEGTEKHRLYHCPEWYEVRREIPEGFQKVGASFVENSTAYHIPQANLQHPICVQLRLPFLLIVCACTELWWVC